MFCGLRRGHNWFIHIPSELIVGMKVSAGGHGVEIGHTRNARPATIAAPRAVLSIIRGRI